MARAISKARRDAEALETDRGPLAERKFRGLTGTSRARQRTTANSRRPPPRRPDPHGHCSEQTPQRRSKAPMMASTRRRVTCPAEPQHEMRQHGSASFRCCFIYDRLEEQKKKKEAIHGRELVAPKRFKRHEARTRKRLTFCDRTRAACGM